jgi:hypothetical protein
MPKPIIDGTQRPIKIADSLSPLNQSVSEKTRERNAEPISRISATVNFLIIIVILKHYYFTEVIRSKLNCFDLIIYCAARAISFKLFLSHAKIWHDQQLKRF